MRAGGLEFRNYVRKSLNRSTDTYFEEDGDDASDGSVIIATDVERILNVPIAGLHRFPVQEEHVLLIEMLEQVERLNLTQEESDAFFLRIEDGVAYEDIGKQFGKTPEAIRSQHRRILKKLGVKNG